MTTFPLPTLAPTITAAGITIPAYEDVLASLQASYRSVYGLDTDLSSNTQDGQFLGILAQAIYDTNDAIVTVFNGFSPSFAQGTSLSSLVKINGLNRESATFSTAPAQVIGQAGVSIPSGIISDGFGNQWTLPPNVLIPVGGSIDITLTCSVPGAITLASGSTTAGDSAALSFVTIIPGWQSLTTTSDATAGVPVETDSALRQRQTISTGLPAQTPLNAILSNVANLPGVTDYAIYENDTDTTDSNSIPPHSISVIVGGGDAVAIATAISEKKSPGTGTYGSTTEVIVDPSGVPNTIRFYPRALTSVYVKVSLTPLGGYQATTAGLIQQVVAAWISALLIGQDVQYWKLSNPINLSGTVAQQTSTLTQGQLDELAATYDVTAVALGTAPSPTGTSDVIIAFNHRATCVVANVEIITP